MAAWRDDPDARDRRLVVRTEVAPATAAVLGLPWNKPHFDHLADALWRDEIRRVLELLTGADLGQ
ncbi:MAG: hypothetical protein IPM89_00005 [Candidatus Competibacteraceae bacterium]|nr:MAG: hypothetical protein IPM89_00005 [Candidatus Competibacteraceae bacterium]